MYYWFYSYAALAPFKSTPGYMGMRWKLMQQCLEYRQQLLAYKNETPYTYRARRPNDVPDEEVSFCYQDHGNWQT
jgi:hypothetical protein